MIFFLEFIRIKSNIKISNKYYFKVKNNKKRFFIVKIYQTLTFFQ